MNKKFLIAGVVVGLIVVGLFLIFFQKDLTTNLEEERVTIIEPLDVALDFYGLWLDAVQSTSTDPFAEGLHTNSALSQAVKDTLQNIHEQGNNTEVDPVLCQDVIPKSIGAKELYALENEVQLLIIARREELPGQAVVTLSLQDSQWVISDIKCASGESAPDREFTFEQQGILLKDVPAPLDSQYWHLVFEENGIMGHAAPLFFDASSTCVALDGSEAVCEPNKLTQISTAVVQGEMTEAGVDVTRLKIVE